MTPYEAEQFKTALYNTINNCNLTFPTAFLIIEKIYEEMKEQYYLMAEKPPEYHTVEENGYSDGEHLKGNEDILEPEPLE